MYCVTIEGGNRKETKKTERLKLLLRFSYRDMDEKVTDLVIYIYIYRERERDKEKGEKPTNIGTVAEREEEKHRKGGEKERERMRERKRWGDKESQVIVEGERQREGIHHTIIITISNIYQLTQPLADTVEGSHSNRKRTTSR